MSIASSAAPSPNSAASPVTFPSSYADACAGAAATGFDVELIFERAAITARELLDRAGPQLTRLLFVGSGDSLFAARSALPAIQRWTGLYAEAQTSLTLARYGIPLLDERDVVVAVSNSGNSTRTREGVTLAKAAGRLTVGITGSDTGPLAQGADLVLHRPVVRDEALPDHYRRVFLNMSEYLAALAAHWALALEIGVLRDRLTAAERDGWLARIREGLAQIGPAAHAIEPAIATFVAETEAFDTVWTIGAGPNVGTAEYSAAKFHEQAPLNGVPQDLEEWAHLQYFLTVEGRANGPVIVLAPSGNAVDRAEEMLTGIANAGGTALLATDVEALTGPASVRLAMPRAPHELLSPLTFHLPAQLLALHVARGRDLSFLPLRRRDDYWLIRHGAIRTDPAGLD